MGDTDDATQGYDGGPSFSEARKAFAARNAAAAAASANSPASPGDKSLGTASTRKPVPSAFDSAERKTGGLQGLKAKTKAMAETDYAISVPPGDLIGDSADAETPREVRCATCMSTLKHPLSSLPSAICMTHFPFPA
jgi:hypothetical protein